MSQADIDESQSSFENEDVFSTAAFLCASAINNGWLRDFDETSTDEDLNSEQEINSYNMYNNIATDSTRKKIYTTTASENDNYAPPNKLLKTNSFERSKKSLKVKCTAKERLFREQHFSSQNFDKLLNLIEKDIKKQATCMRVPISAEDKLVAVLLFLITGATFRDLELEMKISLPAISTFIPRVCEAIYLNLKEQYIKFPKTIEEWLQISIEFELHGFNFPNCLGVIDYGHILVRTARSIAALYKNAMNYKSIILTALCDANGLFRFIDVGCAGSYSPTEALQQTELQAFINSTSNELTFRNGDALPYTFIADVGYELQENLMVPSSDIEFSYYNELLLATHSISRKTFGMLWNRFKILQIQTNFNVEKTSKIVRACCTLHNFLLVENGRDYIEPINFNDLTLQVKRTPIIDQYKGTEAGREQQRKYLK